MNLEGDNRLNFQLRLDFSSAPTGEARQAGREDIESPSAVSEPERPANTRRTMEDVCERANLKKALRHVRSNKGSAGVDGMTVDQLGDYLKQHWPAIREQLLTWRLSEAALAGHSGAIAERDLRTETGKAGGNPEAGWRWGAKAWRPNRAGSLRPASGDAGTAAAMEPDVLPSQLWISTASVGASSRCPSSTVHYARLRLGDRS